MSDNTKHLAKKCVKDAGPCLVLCLAGAAVALLAVLGPFDVLRSASSLHVIIALAGAMMTGGVLDLIFWVLDPFGGPGQPQLPGNVLPQGVLVLYHQKAHFVFHPSRKNSFLAFFFIITDYSRRC